MLPIRRTLARILPPFVVAAGVLSAPVIAEELRGLLTQVDIEKKTVTITIEDGSEVVVSVRPDTQYVTPKGTASLELEKMVKSLERAQSKGRKGFGVLVIHEESVASQIKVEARKREKGQRPPL